jgi:GTP-binding protein HflX
VGLRGPGETQLEVDRRAIRTRISNLKKELEKVRSHRRQYRSRRKKAEISTIALVGYTNAGKTTLLNYISGSDIYVADQLFATLDPTTRRIELPDGNQALLTDTVGFIQKLPTTLVAAFRATLEEIAEADILLHVVDISHPNALAQSKVVRETLEEIDVHGLPVVTALNKIDTLPDQQVVHDSLDDFERAVAISALTGEGVGTLLMVLEENLHARLIPITVSLPYKEGRLINLFHEHGIVETIDHQDTAVQIQGRLPTRMISEFEGFSSDRDQAQ